MKGIKSKMQGFNNHLTIGISRGINMGWSRAYHFNSDEYISINDAMEMRTGKDPRVGDLWCHKTCFNAKIGAQLLTRQQGSDGRKACFAKWPGRYEQSGQYCGQKLLSDSKRESMDYAYFYTEFDKYLNGIEKNKEPFFIKRISKPSENNIHDFNIYHTNEISEMFTETELVILDENKRKIKKYVETKIVEGKKGRIVIKISEYTPAQLTDFARGGIDKFKKEWEFLQQQKKNELKRIKKALEEEEEAEAAVVRSVAKEKAATEERAAEEKKAAAIRKKNAAAKEKKYEEFLAEEKKAAATRKKNAAAKEKADEEERREKIEVFKLVDNNQVDANIGPEKMKEIAEKCEYTDRLHIYYYLFRNYGPGYIGNLFE
jgi:hypothetical protein